MLASIYIFSKDRFNVSIVFATRTRACRSNCIRIRLRMRHDAGAGRRDRCRSSRCRQRSNGCCLHQRSALRRRSRHACTGPRRSASFLEYAGDRGGRSGGRRCRGGPAKAICRSSEGCQGATGILQPVQQGRKSLAGDQAGAIRPSLFPAGQSDPRHRRSRAVSKPDAAFVYRGVSSAWQPGTAHRQELPVFRHRRHPAGACGSRIDQRQPSVRRAGGEPTTSGKEVNTDRRQCAAARRYSRRLERARSRVSHRLWLRCAQLQLYRLA